MVEDSAEPGAERSLKHYLRPLTLVLFPLDDGKEDGGT